MDAIIRFCFHIDPEELSDDEYAKTWGQAKYALDYSLLLKTKAKIEGH
jgi:hypothetical protein